MYKFYRVKGLKKSKAFSKTELASQFSKICVYLPNFEWLGTPFAQIMIAAPLHTHVLVSGTEHAAFRADQCSVSTATSGRATNETPELVIQAGVAV